MDSATVGHVRTLLENGLTARPIWDALKVLKQSPNKNPIIWAAIRHTFDRIAGLWGEDDEFPVSPETGARLNDALLADIVFLVEHLSDQEVAPIEDRLGAYLEKVDDELSQAR